jgi:hypothetical protein
MSRPPAGGVAGGDGVAGAVGAPDAPKANPGDGEGLDVGGVAVSLEVLEPNEKGCIG